MKKQTPLENNIQDDQANADEALLSPKALKQRSRLLEAVSLQRQKTLDERVSWILNHFVSTRNSDITLQLRYWSAFESDIYNGIQLNPNDLYKLTPLTSLARSRAKIQNQYKLFLAKAEVRKRRGTIETEEYAKHVETMEDYPSVNIYMDESGKTQANFVVGSVWFLDSKETFNFVQEVLSWRKELNFQKEFHFKEVNKNTLSIFSDYIKLAKRVCPTMSFRYVNIPSTGIKNTQSAIQRLFTLLLLQGISHDIKIGRIGLPRTISVWKDAEEAGADKILLADIRLALEGKSTTTWNGNLIVDTLEPVPSLNNPMIQLSDLFTSALSRRLNRESTDSGNIKDKAADLILEELGVPDAMQMPFENDNVVEIAI